MAESDRPEDEALQQPAPKPKRRRRPPTLDLTAKEIGEGAANSENREQAGTQAPKPGAADNARPGWRARASAFDANTLLSVPVLAGLGGIVAGALLVYLFAMPREGGADPRVAELTGEIAKLSARVETLATRPMPVTPAADSPALAQRIDRLTAAIGETEQRLAGIEKRPLPQPADLSGVNQRTAAIEDALKDLRSALGDLRRAAEQAPPAATPAAVDKLSSQIGGLEQRIATLAAPRVAAAANSVAEDLIALNTLATAVQSGRPFAKELEIARTRLGERAAPLAKIEPFAAKGLPTTSVLAERFGELASELLRGPEPDDDFLSRLLANASRLVEVRQVGEPTGSGVSAIVARTETKLGRGDLAAAITEIEALPEPGKSKAAGWLAAARERRDIDVLLKSFVDASLATNAERAKP
jgi:hypothetical protein